MSDERNEPIWEKVRGAYHVPPEPPRDEMWRAVSERLDTAPAADEDVIDLSRARRRRGATPNRILGWSVAAAAMLVLGIGIGRMTAPTETGAPMAVRSAPGTSAATLDMVARQHFGRTESLLTMVRADARDGRVDPATAAWAEDMLSQTRLLLDARKAAEPAVDDLLLDLELVLIQIVGIAATGSMDEARARMELGLALRTLEEGEVLPRIQAVLPDEMSGA